MIVAGFGFRAGATEGALASALAAAGARPDALATAADKADAPAFGALAARLGLPVHRRAAGGHRHVARSRLTHVPARYGGPQSGRGGGSGGCRPRRAAAPAPCRAAAGPPAALAERTDP
jgi:cobalt-precorrin 5A hydrolase